jgi:hypothetical protein
VIRGCFAHGRYEMLVRWIGQPGGKHKLARPGGVLTPLP